MPLPLACLIAYAAWALILVITLGATRVSQVLCGKKKSNEFPAGVPHGTDRYWRLNRAHLNTTENLPIAATVILAALFLHVSSPLFGTLAVALIAGRIAQSLIHIASGSVLAVNARFTAYVVQLVSLAGIILLTLKAAPPA